MAKRFALIVAVEHYHMSEQLPDVSFAISDAQAVGSALLGLGYDPSAVTVILDEKATRTTVMSRASLMAKCATGGDSVLLYFAGHGLCQDGTNFLAAVDTDTWSVADTAVPLGELLVAFEESKCKSVMVFLDCCHSGLKFEKGFRGAATGFSSEGLMRKYGSSEYLAVFSACQKDEQSWPSSVLRHGVWTYHLVRALTGDAPDAYESGLLFSDRLQSYLHEETRRDVLTNTATKAIQSPVKFGRETSRFIVANLGPVLEKRLCESAEKAKGISVEGIKIWSEERDEIRSLPGFNPSSHSLPRMRSDYTGLWVEGLAEDLLVADVKEIFNGLRKHAGYTLKDFGKVKVDTGYKSLTARGFDYTISISQDRPGSYVLRRELDNFERNSVFDEDGFNLVFERVFDHFSVAITGDLDIKAIIMSVEAAPKGKGLTVDYDLSNLSWCRISGGSLGGSVLIGSDTVDINVDSKRRPKLLLEAYLSARLALADSEGPGILLE